MKKLSDLGHTGKQALLSGLVFMTLGLLFILYGHQLPRLGYQLFFAYLFITALWQLISRWFRRKDLRENLLITLAKLLLSSLLANAIWIENTAVYLLTAAIAIYQLFIAFVHLVTWFLYRQNGIRPRFHYLLDGLWIGGFGLYSISPFHDAANFELFLLGWYLMTLGLTRLRDGFFFSSQDQVNPLKRRLRVSLPIVFTALIPAKTLQKVNTYFHEHDQENLAKAYNQSKEGAEAKLEIFVHTAQTSLFSAIGHVDICYQGRVISYGNYDPASEKFFGMVGDGVLYSCDRESYIELCQRESQKTLFGYGISLTPDQEAAIQEKLAAIKDLLLPWDPTQADQSRTEISYASKIQTQAGGELFKFKGSKFKSYFVLSTNCVLLADSIVGQAGTDILSPKGFIAPGTYQAYLDAQYERPHSLVVSKKIYQ